MQQRAAKFPFSDLHSFKDYVGFLKLCAPDQFPPRQGAAANTQWTLDLALEGLRLGLHVSAAEGADPAVLSQCGELFETAFEHYRAGNLHDGFCTMEAAQRLLATLPSH